MENGILRNENHTIAHGILVLITSYSNPIFKIYQLKSVKVT